MEYKKENPFLFVYDIEDSEYKTNDNTIRYLGRQERKIVKIAQRKRNFEYDVTYTLNKMGYRCKYDRPPDTDYILVAGCSISYGHSIPQEYRYSDLLEKHYEMPVVNIAVSGGSSSLIKDNILQLLISGHRLPKVLIAQWPQDNRYWIGRRPYGIDDNNIDGFVEASKHAFETTNYLCNTHNIPILNIKDLAVSNDFDIHILAHLNYYDRGRDGIHPGIESHKMFSDQIIDSLLKKNILRKKE